VELNSKRIEVADPIAAIETMYAANMTDGLPVIPPSPERVEEFLTHAGLDPATVIGEVKERSRVITAEKLAINAVMAGCLPQYMPVLVAAVQAVCDPAFKFNHLASLGSPMPMFIVSGPVVDEIGMHYGRYLFGSGNRANSTIGRAMNLLMWNCCELRPDAIQGGQLGSPQRFAFCIAENPRTRWEGLNEWEGFSRDTSTVTAFSGYLPCRARTESTVPEAILAPMVLSLVRHEFLHGCFVVIIPPNFEDLLVSEGWTKRKIRDYFFANCKRSVADLKRAGRWGRLTSTPPAGDLKDLFPVEPEDETTWIHMFAKDEPIAKNVFHEASLSRRADILIVAAGGPVGMNMIMYEPYSQSTSPVTKAIRSK
jgi:hypothetical protein